MAERQSKKRQIKYFDYSLLFIIIFLIIWFNWSGAFIILM